ncbi:MAG: selenide, water dikinase SelD [Actinomycetota bacterium]
MTQPVRLTAYSHGAGCACKLSPDDLHSIIAPLRSHPAVHASSLVVGFETADDGAVWRLPAGELLIHTVDFFTPIVDDPYDWGRIAAANALSDVYAMGGRPLTALQLVGWPRTALPFSLLSEVVKGGADVMAESGTTIVGGHSIDDPEPKYGLAVTGLAPASGPITNAGARPGDILVLTKPLGMGVVSTALKRGVCPDGLARAAIEVMTTLNAGAVGPMIEGGATAATDVTGFGLLGHLREMLMAAGVGGVIDSTAVPILDGVLDLIAAGVYPGGSERNLASLSGFISADGVEDHMVRALADAQTSGGLLIAVPADKADSLVRALSGASTLARAVIGRVIEGTPHLRIY